MLCFMLSRAERNSGNNHYDTLPSHSQTVWIENYNYTNSNGTTWVVVEMHTVAKSFSSKKYVAIMLKMLRLRKVTTLIWDTDKRKKYIVFN